jgi:hypothetical protein
MHNAYQIMVTKRIKHILNSHNSSNLFETKNITPYTHYVDDILIICDSTKMDAKLITSNINKIKRNITFSPTYEDNGQNNFLDLLLIQKESN